MMAAAMAAPPMPNKPPTPVQRPKKRPRQPSGIVRAMRSSQLVQADHEVEEDQQHGGLARGEQGRGQREDQERQAFDGRDEQDQGLGAPQSLHLGGDRQLWRVQPERAHRRNQRDSHIARAEVMDEEREDGIGRADAQTKGKEGDIAAEDGKVPPLVAPKGHGRAGPRPRAHVRRHHAPPLAGPQREKAPVIQG
jgi:hypothetical protein